MDEATLKRYFDESNALTKKQFEETNENIDKKLKPIVSRIVEIEKKVDINTKRTDEWEKAKRKRNIIIFGMEQEKEENYITLEEKVRNMLREKMDITVLSTEVDSIKRIGKDPNKRPIFMALTTWRKKMEIITNGKKLKNTGIFISEDYPPEVQKIRKELAVVLKEHRKNGKKAYIKYDKIVIVGENNGEDNLEEDEKMDEDVEEINETDYAKRKAENELGPEILSGVSSDTRKKYITPKKTPASGGKIVLNQSKIDPFLFQKKKSSQPPSTQPLNSEQSSSQQSNSQMASNQSQPPLTESQNK